MIQWIQRWSWLFLVAAILVFFSEKMYWHVTGFTFVPLVLFYMVPTGLTLMWIERFQVSGLAGMILAAGFYAVIVEGVITPVIYEAGLFDPIMPLYFMAWHGLLAFVFGYYLLRQWLGRGEWLKITISSTLVGIMWGLWAISYWLPENIAEWEAIAATGDPAIPGVWEPMLFAQHSFLFTILLVIAHIVRRWVEPQALHFTRWERWLCVGIGIFFFVTIVAMIYPLAIFKLAAMLGLLTWGAISNRKPTAQPSRPSSFYLSATLPLFLMPTCASVIYLIAHQMQLDLDIVLAISELITFSQMVAAAGALIWAITTLFRSRSKPTTSISAQGAVD